MASASAWAQHPPLSLERVCLRVPRPPGVFNDSLLLLVHRGLLFFLIDALELLGAELSGSLALEEVEADPVQVHVVIDLHHLPLVPAECSSLHSHPRPDLERHRNLGRLHHPKSLEDPPLLISRQGRWNHMAPPRSDASSSVLPRAVMPHEVEDVVGVLDHEPRVLVHAHTHEDIASKELLLLLYRLVAQPQLGDLCAWNENLDYRLLQAAAICNLSHDSGLDAVL
mmetsp:Transcript_9658/g.32328  ORF Transcript_9658/g.32328 Transcript_9658/m.32328 type:complete len:226 (-) Transcript_9658:475-1152(-)